MGTQFFVKAMVVPLLEEMAIEIRNLGGREAIGVVTHLLLSVGLLQSQLIMGWGLLLKPALKKMGMVDRRQGMILALPRIVDPGRYTAGSIGTNHPAIALRCPDPMTPQHCKQVRMLVLNNLFHLVGGQARGHGIKIQKVSQSKGAKPTKGPRPALFQGSIGLQADCNQRCLISAYSSFVILSFGILIVETVSNCTMPLIKVQTSLTSPEAPATEALLKRLSSSLAQHLGKPESYVMTALESSIPMTFAGTTEPVCYVEIKSVGTLSPQQTKTMSQDFCQYISDTLGVPRNRIYIEFADAQGYLWGWDGRTFG